MLLQLLLFKNDVEDVMDCKASASGSSDWSENNDCRRGTRSCGGGGGGSGCFRWCVALVESIPAVFVFIGNLRWDLNVVGLVVAAAGCDVGVLSSFPAVDIAAVVPLIFFRVVFLVEGVAAGWPRCLFVPPVLVVVV
jgi:hypothetical protein